MDKKKLNIQLCIAGVLTVAGIVLLFMGFWTAPAGEIHNSILIAYGEVSTFAASVLGIDYSYKLKKYNENIEKKD